MPKNSGQPLWPAMLLAALVFCTMTQTNAFLVERKLTAGRGNSFSSLVLLSSSPPSPAQESVPSIIPTRKAKHKDRKRKTTKKVSRGSGGRILTEQELAHHVSAQYITGRGGVLRESHAKAKRREETTRLKEIDPDFNQHLRDLDRHPALVLNANYQPMSYLPLSMWHWQEVVKAVFSGKVTVVDVYPDVTIRAANLALPLPSVIALNDYVPQFQQRPAFTKRNVFLRDEYRCQYCNHMFHTRDLSLDHVVPRCMGGRLNWENAVTCCRSCNGRKGHLYPHQLASVGMKLLRNPFVPTQFELAAIAGRMLPRRVHPTWAPFLGLSPTPENVDLVPRSDFDTDNLELEDELLFDDIDP